MQVTIWFQDGSSAILDNRPGYSAEKLSDAALMRVADNLQQEADAGTLQIYEAKDGQVLAENGLELWATKMGLPLRE